VTPNRNKFRKEEMDVISQVPAIIPSTKNKNPLKMITRRFFRSATETGFSVGWVAKGDVFRRVSS
jgi:hypothetical protein